MPIEVRYVETGELVECVYSGEVSPQEMVESILAAAELAKVHGTLRACTDLTLLTTGPSVTELFGVPKLFEELNLPRSLREAIIAPTVSANVADVQFYENVCTNRGWNVRVFPDRAQALAWLTLPPD